MTRLGDLFLIPEWTASEREAVARLLSRIESIALDVGSRIDVKGHMTELRAGSVLLSPSGITIKTASGTSAEDIVSLKWYDPTNPSLDFPWRISPFFLSSSDDPELDLVVGRTNTAQTRFNTSRFHIDMNTRNTAGTGLNTLSVRGYTNYDATAFSPGSPNWFDFELLVARLTRDGTTWKPFAFHEDPNNSTSWLAFDSGNLGLYGYAIGTASDGRFQLTSNYYIDEAGHRLLTIEGRTSPLSIVVNEDGRDIDFRVEGDTITDVFGVDAGLDAVTFGNYVRFDEVTAPGTPAAGTVSVYAKTDGLLYSKDDAGAETLVSGGAGGGDDSEFLAAPVFVNTFGSATSTDLASTQSTLNFRSFSMPDGAEVVLTTQWRIPPGVTGTITYKIYWAMNTNATGNVRWIVALASVANGEVLTAGSEEADALLTAASGVAKRLQVTTGTFTSAVAGGDLVGVIVDRQGAHATDTAGAAAHFLGIEFTW